MLLHKRVAALVSCWAQAEREARTIGEMISGSSTRVAERRTNCGSSFANSDRSSRSTVDQARCCRAPPRLITQHKRNPPANQALDRRHVKMAHATAENAAKDIQAANDNGQHRSDKMPVPSAIATGTSGCRSRFGSITAVMNRTSANRKSRSTHGRNGSECPAILGFALFSRYPNVKQTTTVSPQRFAQSPISDYSGSEAFALTTLPVGYRSHE